MNSDELQFREQIFRSICESKNGKNFSLWIDGKRVFAILDEFEEKQIIEKVPGGNPCNQTYRCKPLDKDIRTDVRCSRCDYDRLRLSHRREFWDWLRRLLGRKPYICGRCGFHMFLRQKRVL